MEQTKTCNKCNKTKLVNDFYRDNLAIDGYRAECKECKKIYDKQYHTNNPIKDKKKDKIR